MRGFLIALAVGCALLVALALAGRCGGDAGPAPVPAAGVGARDAAASELDPAAAAEPAAARGERAETGSDGRSVLEQGDEFAAARTGYVGRVLSRGGAPVPGMLVRLCRLAADLVLVDGLDAFARTPAAPEFVAATATTGTDGRFELLGVLPRGLCFLRLDFPEPAAVPPPLRAGHGTMIPVQRTPAPGEVVDLGDLLLKAGARLTGRVVGDDHEPVQGALLRAARLPPLPYALLPIERLRPDGALLVTAAGQQLVVDLPSWVAQVLALLPIAETRSDRSGGFAIDGVDAGETVLAVTAPARGSLLRQGIDVAPGAELALGDLRLPDGETATVAVVDAQGRAVADAEVLVAPQSVGVPVHIAERAGRTGTDGTVAVHGLPPGAALAAARRTPREPWQLGAPGPAAGRLQVVLPAAYTLALTVLDGGGRPADSVRLQLVAGAGGLRVLEQAMFGLVGGIDLRDRLRRRDDGSLLVERLPAGGYSLVVGARGCAATSLDLDLRADVERTVQLRPARSLRVRVLDPLGDGVAGARLFVHARGGERAQRIVDLPLPAGRTGQGGWCTIDDLPTGQARVTAMHPLHGQVHGEVEGQPTELLLRFEHTGTIDGQLTDGGRPPPPGRWLVVLERRQGNGPRGAVPDLPQLALPDLAGEFTFGALAPGPYRLTVQDSATDVGTIAGVIEYQARRKRVFPWNKAEVELHAGEHLEVRLDAMLDAAPFDGPGAAVRGVVTIDGAPAAGALVVGTSKQPERRVANRVDRGGAFDLGHVPAGPLRLVVVPREVAESRLLEHLFSHHFARDLEIVPGTPLDLRIEIATGSVEGTVADWNGAGVADCRVVLHDRGGGGRSSALRVTRSDRQGAFRFGELPAGVYELRALKESLGAASVAGVEVRASQVTGPLALRLLASARLSGTVQVQGLPRQAPLGLVLHPLAGGEPVRGGAKADGTFALSDVPAGRYRVEIGQWGNPVRYSAGELDVAAPATTGVVLVPTPQ